MFLLCGFFCSHFVIWAYCTCYGMCLVARRCAIGNILEEFWYGNINPQEQSKESSWTVKELLKLMGRNRDRLYDSMSAEQRETLGKYDDCVKEIYCIMELEILSYAFRLGGRLRLAALMDNSEDA